MTVFQHKMLYFAQDNYNQTYVSMISNKNDILYKFLVIIPLIKGQCFEDVSNWLDLSFQARDTSGATALHNACGQGHTDVAKLLLMTGAQLMTWDNEHLNPLHYAALGGHLGVSIILLFVLRLTILCSFNHFYLHVPS